MKLAIRPLIIYPPGKLAGEPGFEPGLHGPEPCVLPLDYSPVLPPKTGLGPTTKIGQKIQGFLPKTGLGPKIKKVQKIQNLLYFPQPIISPPTSQINSPNTTQPPPQTVTRAHQVASRPPPRPQMAVTPPARFFPRASSGGAVRIASWRLWCG